MFVNTTAGHAVPIFLNLLSNMYYQRLSNRDPAASIVLRMDPLPLTSEQEALTTSFTAVFIAIAFAFIPASFAGFMVKERETKVKHQQLISGVSITAYWLSTYAWDILITIVNGIMCIIVFYILDIKQLTGDNLGATIIILLLYAFSIAPFTYFASFAFTSHVTAQNVLLLVYIMAGGILQVVSIVLDLISATRDANTVLKYFYRLMPSFCFGEAFASLIVRESAFIYGTSRDVWDFDILGRPAIYMTVFGALYMTLVFLVEKILSTPEWLHYFSNVPKLQIDESSQPDDPDVAAERQRIQSHANGKHSKSGLRNNHRCSAFVTVPLTDVTPGSGACSRH